MLALDLTLYLLSSLCFFAFAVAFEARWVKLNLLGLGVFFWSVVPLIHTIMKF